MDLTPEERQRIYEEEKARVEAGEKAKTEAKKKAEAQQTKQGCIGCLSIIVVVVIIAAIGGLFSGGDDDSKKSSGTKGESTTTTTAAAQAPKAAPAPKKEQDRSIDAWVMCKGFVKDRLKAPSTAKFPWYDENRVTSLGDGVYTVSSYVDAENSFGAKLRTQYVCTVKYAGDDRWQLQDIVTNE